MEIHKTLEGLTFTKKVGDLDVLINESIHISSNKEVLIKFSDLSLKFVFTKDTDNKESRFEGKTEEKLLTISLVNFTNSLGEGVLEPILIGDLFERKLYLTFYAWTPDIENGLRIINYSFYLGEKHNGNG